MRNWLSKTIAATVLISLSCIVLADPPPASGKVERFEGQQWFTWIDPEKGLRVVLGLDPKEFCAGAGSPDLLEVQAADLGDFRIVMNASAEMRASVWDFTEIDCGRFLTEDPVASGYARVRYVDNDVFGTVVNNANSWTIMANGKLEDPWGSTAILRAFISQLYSENSGYKRVADVELH